jgi:uncharacterized protein YoxC
MDYVTFIIAIIALIISILAYRRTGGAKELKKTVDSLSSTMESLKERTGDSLRDQVEKLTSVTESLRDRTANAIDRLESAIRGKEEEKAAEKKAPEEKTPTPRRSRGKRE